MSILNLIASRNFISVNRDLINVIGLEAAILLGELASEYEYYAENEMLIDGSFYSTVANLEEHTGLSKYQQQQAFKTLQSMNIVSIQKRGIPAKRYIQINEQQVIQLFADKWAKNSPTSELKTNSQEVEKLDGNKNKEIITNNENEKNIYGEFQNVLLTDAEYEKVKEQGMQNILEELSGYIASTGRRYKSHYATILNWKRRKEQETKRIAEQKKKGHLKSKPTYDIEEIKRRTDFDDDYEKQLFG